MNFKLYVLQFHYAKFKDFYSYDLKSVIRRISVKNLDFLFVIVDFSQKIVMSADVTNG